MLRSTLWLACALAFVPAVHAAGGNDDEAWLRRTMSAPMAPGVPVSPERVRRVEFDALPRLAGHRVNVETVDGASTQGLLERADAETVALRVLRSTGLATISFARADVRAIRVD